MNYFVRRAINVAIGVTVAFVLHGLFHHAHAAVPIVAGEFSPWPAPFNPYLPSPLSSGPTVAASTSSGLSRSLSGNVAEFVAAAGGPVNVSTTVTATLPTSKLASAAIALLPLAPVGRVLGTALAVGLALQNSGLGYTQCPAGSVDPYTLGLGVCRPDPSQHPNQVPLDNSQVLYYQNTASSMPCYGASHLCGALDAANAMLNIPASGKTLVRMYADPIYYNQANVWRIDVDFSNPGSSTVYTTSMASTGTETFTQPPLVYPSSTQATSDLNTRFTQAGSDQVNVFNAMTQDQTEYGNMPSPFDANTPVSVTASTVTTPSKVVSVQQVPQSDGSTNTVTTSQQTTITPTTTGTTAGTAQTTYNQQTTTTVTTVNSVTNNTTTQTTQSNASDTPQQDPCATNPNSLACQQLTAPPTEAIDKTSKAVSYAPDTVNWGASASCPAPISIGSFAGASRQLDFQVFCDTATQMRPFVLAASAASAIFIVFLAFKL